MGGRVSVVCSMVQGWCDADPQKNQWYRALPSQLVERATVMAYGSRIENGRSGSDADRARHC